MDAFLSVLFLSKKGKDTRGVRCVSCCKCSGEVVVLSILFYCVLFWLAGPSRFALVLICLRGFVGHRLHFCRGCLGFCGLNRGLFFYGGFPVGRVTKTLPVKRKVSGFALNRTWWEKKEKSPPVRGNTGPPSSSRTSLNSETRLSSFLSFLQVVVEPFVDRNRLLFLVLMPP